MERKVVSRAVIIKAGSAQAPLAREATVTDTVWIDSDFDFDFDFDLDSER